MTRTSLPSRVAATDAARAGLRRLTVAHGRVILFQSGGCCDGSLPLCLRAGDLIIARDDVLLGTIDDTNVYIAAEQDARWNHPDFVVDVSPGAPEGFSLGGTDWHFVTRTPRAADR